MQFFSAPAHGVVASDHALFLNAQDRVQIRWYVGLGAGTDAGQTERQQAVVDDFNASQEEIDVDALIRSLNELKGKSTKRKSRGSPEVTRE